MEISRSYPALPTGGRSSARAEGSASPADSTPPFLGESAAQPAAAEALQRLESSEPSELQEVFQDFVGQTFFGEMIKAMRSAQQPSAYFHGGRAEEIFQGQLDQVLAEELSDASAKKIAEPMFELFQLGRQR